MRGLAFPLCIAGALAPPDAAPQVRYGADVMLRPRYEWRGLTRASDWVLQPDLYLSAGGALTITVGGWTSYGLDRTDPGDLGFGRGWFRETELWAELSAEPVRGLDVAAGWLGTLANVTGPAGTRPSLTDTHELYARVRFRRFRLVPEVAVFQDVHAARGTYVEGGLDAHLPIWTRVVLPVGDLVASARLGAAWSLDPSLTDPDQLAYFAEDGLTHLAFGLRTVLGPLIPFDAGVSAALHLAWRIEHNIDARTERVTALGTASWHQWFELGISIWGPRCRPSRSICP